MKRVMNGLTDLIIFTISFLVQEILMRTDIIQVQGNLWMEYISFIVIYLIVYILVKVLVFYTQRKKRKKIKNPPM